MFRNDDNISSTYFAGYRRAFIYNFESRRVKKISRVYEHLETWKLSHQRSLNDPLPRVLTATHYMCTLLHLLAPSKRSNLLRCTNPPACGGTARMGRFDVRKIVHRFSIKLYESHFVRGDGLLLSLNCCTILPDQDLREAFMYINSMKVNFSFENHTNPEINLFRFTFFYCGSFFF